MNITVRDVIYSVPTKKQKNKNAEDIFWPLFLKRHDQMAATYKLLEIWHIRVNSCLNNKTPNGHFLDPFNRYIHNGLSNSSDFVTNALT